jgi:hypothetical protein
MTTLWTSLMGLLGSIPCRNTGYPDWVLWVFSGPPRKSVFNENSKPTFVISFLLMMVVVVKVPFMTNHTLFHQYLLAQEKK